ncbi:MAG: prenyltransferase [Myxococcales bacterium]|nr:prenyltransferase [Myxococcales bacterium]
MSSLVDSDSSARLARIAEGVFRIADPKITLASVASMVVGAAFAAAAGPIAWGWLALTVLGVFFVEAAKNASGELFDWDSGTDQAVAPHERTPFSGGKRVIVDGLLTRSETALVAAVFYLLATVVGLWIVVAREPMVLGLALVGVALAYFYHAPPLALAYRGLGELAVAVSYGPLIASGTYLVQRGAVDGPVLAASIPLGLAIMAFLWINELPDSRADALAGKRTLVVRLGPKLAAEAFFSLWVAAAAVIAVLPAFGLPATLWLGLVGLPLGLRAASRFRATANHTDPKAMQDIIPAQAWTLIAFLLMAVGLSLGALIG